MSSSENTQKLNEELKNELTDEDMTKVSGGALFVNPPSSGPIEYEDAAHIFPTRWYDAEKDEVYHFECPACHSIVSESWTGAGYRYYCGCGDWYPSGSLERVSDGSWDTYNN